MFVFYSIPTEYRDGGLHYSECKMYDLNYTDLIENYVFIENIISNRPDSKNTLDCKHGWIYDKSTYQNTVVVEVRLFHY